MAPSQCPVPQTVGFVEGYSPNKPAGFIERPKLKTQRVGLGKVIINPTPLPAKEQVSTNKKNNEFKLFTAVPLISKAKAMMEEGDQRTAYESNVLKEEKKKILQKERHEAYLVREAKRQTRKAKELAENAW